MSSASSTRGARRRTRWNASANDIVTEVVLGAGRTYRFRYLLDDERWENDWEADSYVPNEFGGDDSVLDLTQFVTSNGEA